MFELPLFPLNTVLFPGIPLALHIFEDRYKLMIGKCLQERRPFGVVLIRKGAEALGPLPEPNTIGCTAFISQVERLHQGRMNIGVIGQRRVRIGSINTDLPYLRGQVEYYPLREDDLRAQRELAGRLRPWVARYLNHLSHLGSKAPRPEDLPEEPVPLAYASAALLQIAASQKQELLSIERAVALLAKLRKVYRSEIAILKAIGQLPGPELGEDPNRDQSAFSLN
ncbi:MAG: LON peptidase substrate-binding domain-containing protein [Candidatus Promineifilaceae bacterium]|jgi:Lon protease-like protein